MAIFLCVLNDVFDLADMNRPSRSQPPHRKEKQFSPLLKSITKLVSWTIWVHMFRKEEKKV